MEASSGQAIRRRLSRAGDRKLSHALYMTAMTQIRGPSAGQASARSNTQDPVRNVTLSAQNVQSAI
jgi:transposase